MGPIEIIQAGSPERAMSELLEAGDLASAHEICAQLVNTQDFPPLAPLNGKVTMVR